MPETKVISTEPEVGNIPYVAYQLEEDAARVAYHYEVDPEFFLTVTDGEWNNYSASIWEEGFDITQAQEKKLDKYAEMMDLKPGMRILDVGCGWGGPLVYLCKTYGVQGHGITVSPMQIPIAEARAERYGVDATFDVGTRVGRVGEEEIDRHPIEQPIEIRIAAGVATAADARRGARGRRAS